ncbi:MAG: glycoside hydrolase family 31 protein [Deltaproteobacteria bacterium]|nr:glycoside hydrolase family 31 protein [Deltaproteobacteria bacterium]
MNLPRAEGLAQPARAARRALAALGAAVVLVVVSAGCIGENGEDGFRSPVAVSIGDDTWRVSFDASLVTLRLVRGGDTLLELGADALALGTVDRLDDQLNYDPYWLGSPLYDPQGLAWVTPASATITASEGIRSFTAELTYSDATAARLTVTASASGRFAAKLVPHATSRPIAFMRLAPRVDSTEAFYGLGEHYDTVNQRGKVRAMQLEPSLRFESQYNEAHVPIPFVIGTRGWGLFVEDRHPGSFDVAAKADDRIEATFGTAADSPNGLTFHLFAAAHPLDVTKHYYDVTGYPRLPAPWALGPWLWRDENRDQAEVENDANTLRDLDIATSAIWIDRPYATGVNTFDFSAPQFRDPTAMIGTLHTLGFRTALWHTPYLDEEDPSTAELRSYATSHGFYPPRTGLLFNGWGRPIDLTNPDAYAWWQRLIRRYTDAGIEGFKLDYGEDVVPGALGIRDKWNFADGSDERTMHAAFQLTYHQVYAETLPASGGFLLCRHSTYGDQTNVSVIWPGDLDATFARQGEPATDRDGERYSSVGGLPASMVAGLTLGPSGFPFYGSDTGGYRHSPPDKELFTRWFEQTSLSSVMQVGTSTNDVAWEPTPENGFDDEMLGWYRIYTRLHLRLFAYEWTLAQRIAVDGRPIQRPIGLAYPELGSHRADEYLFGEDLLVAPVLERGARERSVLFPPGTWLDWWTSAASPGEREATVEAPLGTLPLWIRTGAIVPLLRPTIDTLSPTTEPARVDSYATTPGVLYPRVAPPESASAGASEITLFDGTRLGQSLAGSSLELTVEPGSEFRHGVVFEVLGVGPRAAGVTESGSALARHASLGELEAAGSGWFADTADRGSLWIKVPAGSHTASAALD